MKKIWDIVLTGGPCSGKTTALATIEKELTARGYHVIIVPETASELISNGVRPFGNNALDNVSFQTLLMQQQYNKEKIYSTAAAQIPNNQTVIVYDRGILDSKCYMSQDEFDYVLSTVNPSFKSEHSIYSRYDAIFHLVTAADGAREFYTLANNGARTETPEQAIELDQKGRECWIGHPKFKIIDNSTDFENKMKRLMNEIYVVLGEPIPALVDRKYLVEMPNMHMIVNRRDVEILQSYLSIEKDSEVRVRKITSDNISNYYYTEKKYHDIGVIKIERRIKKRDYEAYLASSDQIYEVKKTRSYFMYYDQYFKLDVFDFENDVALLEIEQTGVAAATDVDPKIPVSINVIREVTGEDFFYNKNIALSQTINFC